MSRLLEQVLHNEESGVILITVSDQLSSDTLKKIYNLILDEEIRSTKDLHLAKDKDKIGKGKYRIFISVYIGKIRLIDNFKIT